MLFRSLHLLLVVAILGCPVWCGLAEGLPVERAGEFASEHFCQCCSHHRAPLDQEVPLDQPSGQEPSKPSSDESQPDESQPDKCQCICDGAVFDRGDGLAPPVLDTALGFAPVEYMARSNSASAVSLHTHHPPEAGPAHGRFLRLLHLSLQI